VSDYAGVRAAARLAGRDRILIDGIDRTFVRDVATTWDRYELTEPFGYGPTALTFPKIHATLEQPGAGDLAWIRKGAEVRIQRVDRVTEELIATDYVGMMMAPRRSGRALTVDVGGQFSGRAALVEKHQRAVRFVGDVGHLAQLCVGDVGLHMDPWNGPVTGIRMVDSGAGEPLVSWAQTVCAMSLTTAGAQWTLMPKVWGGSLWEYRLKDRTTVDFTLFADDARVVIDLADDLAEQPNVWYITGITPELVRIRNIKYPGLQQGPAPTYPITGGDPFGSGTVDADTVNGDGITVLQIKLQQMSYFGWDNPVTGVYNDDTVAAVKRLQDDVDMTTINGIMSETAWDRLWDISATGSSLSGAKPFPVVFDTRVMKYRYSANGSVIGLNPDYDPTIPRVERTIDFGAGWTKQQMVDWCRGEQARINSGANLVGTITLNDFGGWVGEWDTSDYAALNADPTKIMPHRDIRPGMNAWVPNLNGGTLVHVSAVTPQRSGMNTSAVLTVDTLARDAFEVSTLLKRDADARRNLRREWRVSNRAAKPSGNGIPRDEFFGRLFQNVDLEADDWNVPIEIPAGQSGQINRIHLRLINDPCEFAYVLTGKKLTRAELRRRIPNPLAAVGDGEEAWWEKDRNLDLFEDRILINAAGTNEQPCGYWPRKHTNAAGTTTGADVTGKWNYYNSVPYLTGPYEPGMLFLSIYSAGDCTLKAGQVLWAQEDDVV
jgi:hypothetical protein